MKKVLIISFFTILLITGCINSKSNNEQNNTKESEVNMTDIKVIIKDKAFNKLFSFDFWL